VKPSVLITYHNEGALLTECLDSLAAQLDYLSEIIIYDDASVAPAVDYVSEDVTARVLRGESMIGPARARNRLLALAAADYVHFHDADDLFDRRWAERVSAAPAAEIIFTEVESIGMSSHKAVLGVSDIETSDDLIAKAVLGGILIPSATLKTSLARDLGGFDETLWQSEDFDFFIRAALRRPAFVIVNEPLVTIRVRPESRSQERAEVFADALKTITKCSAAAPQWRHLFSEKAAAIGAELFRAGDYKSAGQAFAMSRQLGRPQLTGRSFLYRVLSRFCGFLFAERVAAIYRATIPAGIRGAFR
jgi:glycosyltransferase involved in cell wall biosynthesis